VRLGAEQETSRFEDRDEHVVDGLRVVAVQNPGVMEDPTRVVEHLADLHAARDELLTRALHVVHDQHQAVKRARRGRRDAGPDDDGARRPGRSQLHDPEVVATDVVGAEAFGGYEVAFQGTNGNLWLATVGANGAPFAPTDYGLPMRPGTSPSITFMHGVGYEIAFQGANTDLWVVGADYRGDTGLGMMSGTNPSIASLTGGGWEAAFQANTTNLWTIGADSNGDTGLGMNSGTSPSVTGLAGGGWEAAFQANTGDLWAIGSDNIGNLALGMNSAGTSPSIVAE